MKARRHDIEEVAARFDALDALVPIRAIHTPAEYARAVKALDELLDRGGADESDGLSSIVETLGILVETYEAQAVPIPAASGVTALRFLMDQHDLRQGDLPEIGTQSVVSEVLSGKRELTSRHIAKLRQRFGVSADVFLA